MQLFGFTVDDLGDALGKGVSRVADAGIKNVTDKAVAVITPGVNVPSGAAAEPVVPLVVKTPVSPAVAVVPVMSTPVKIGIGLLAVAVIYLGFKAIRKG